MCAARREKDPEYTREELVMLASLRQSSGRTCLNCEWLQERGPHKGCFPLGKYRKFLSEVELQSGCDRFSRRRPPE